MILPESKPPSSQYSASFNSFTPDDAMSIIEELATNLRDELFANYKEDMVLQDGSKRTYAPLNLGPLS